MSSQQPTHIIILGGGGDLAQRKLLPALFHLYIEERLPKAFHITGLARTARTNEEYCALVRDAIVRKHPMHELSLIHAFCEHVAYVSGSFTEKATYELLAQENEQFENMVGRVSNRLFYLAVPPENYSEIFIKLHESSIVRNLNKKESWTRILVEKPFGNDYVTAQALDDLLSSLFAEEQIFRIDHYLAKEAVQNILSFRFANTLLRSPWNNQHIKEVTITMHETLDVSSRGSFYDAVGALRDVGQNHLLQILALIAMEEPAKLNADHIRAERARVLKKLIPITKDTVTHSVIKAQYEGYADTPGVAKESDTETYFEFKAFLDLEKWKNVPFYVSAGKALKEAKVCIEVTFHDVATGPFETSASASVGNVILLTISPTQSMNITVNVKKPGHGYHIESHTLSYTWDDQNNMPIDAYEKVLLDCIEGDQTLFTQTDEVLASWKFIASIMDNWHKIKLGTYQQGSEGPEMTLKGL